MKRIILIICAALMLASLTSCGKTYTCESCDKTTNKAYYNLSGTEDSVMCEDCARSYWMPFDYKDYRVK